MDAHRPLVKEDRQKFLDEISNTSTNDHETQGEYVATMIVTPPDEKPGIPTDAELTKALEPKADAQAELVKQLDLEQTGETPKTEIEQLFERQNIDGWELIDPTKAEYNSFCAWIIKGETTGDNVTNDRLFSVQKVKQMRFGRSEFDHIQNIMWYRKELLKGKEGAFDLKSILSQNDVRPEEKPLWEALAKKVK
jgi:hypothetical protein